MTPSTDTTEDAEFVIDWDSINANREENERARYDIIERETRDLSVFCSGGLTCRRC